VRLRAIDEIAWFMTFEDGKVIDGTAFVDSIAFNALWKRVKPS
jgi:ketosteroid isomerase-like protein